MLSRLQFAQFRFRLSPVQPLSMPARNKSNVLRGAFGTMLRRLCCHPQCPGARQCELRAACPYARVFEPAPAPGAPALSNYEAIPRPFVIRPPLAAAGDVIKVDPKNRYEPGEELEFGLILVGRIVEFLPYFVLTFERLGEEGLGPNRARCRLERVEQVSFPPSAFWLPPSVPSEPPPVVVFDGASRVMRSPTAHSAMGNSALRAPRSALAVRFLTPTHLVFEEKVVREPEFHHLVRRLRDRLNALATFYCDGPLELDFKGLGERARAVRCTRRDLQWEARERRSARTGRRHDIGGFVGECAFAADGEDGLAEFLPLLELGQYLHVGKHTAWGNGWYLIASAAG